ncbi:hypothetical protein [Rahnella aceris]|uniref:hypothetical protein n=1 Tax=Rahnella sp. (strain Y9602) TaxID=2703885 RepID=UPI00364A25A5
MPEDSQHDFLKYLNEASKTVSDWPIWKQEGSDATRFQETQKSKSHDKKENGCFALKRS